MAKPKAKKKQRTSKPSKKRLLSLSTTCIPPKGWGLVPNGSAMWDMMVWDGTNWILVAYPTTPNGQVWKAGTNGPFWANP